MVTEGLAPGPIIPRITPCPIVCWTQHDWRNRHERPWPRNGTNLHQFHTKTVYEQCFSNGHAFFICSSLILLLLLHGWRQTFPSWQGYYLDGLLNLWCLRRQTVGQRHPVGRPIYELVAPLPVKPLIGSRRAFLTAGEEGSYREHMADRPTVLLTEPGH